MSTHLPLFQSSLFFLHNFVLVKLATSSIRVKCNMFNCLSYVHSLYDKLWSLVSNTVDLVNLPSSKFGDLVFFRIYIWITCDQ